jgi:chromosome partitioning protein
MIVVCEKCQSRFKLDESRIKAQHFKARCSRCHHVFSASKPAPAEPAAPSQDRSVAEKDTPQAMPPRPAARILAISNQKGGVAKTTTCLNLGVSLALLRKRVLLIDFDVQSNLTISLGYQNKPSFYDMLNAPTAEPVETFFIQTDYPGLYLLPSNKNMVLLNKKYFGAPNYEYILRDRLTQIRDRFDYILIDTPPSIEFFTLNALTTSDLVIIPSQCDYLSTHGVDQVMKLIDLIRQKTNPAITARMLITMYNDRATASQVIYSKLQRIYGDQTFKTLVNYDDKLREAQIMSMPVIHYDQSSRSGQQYMDLAQEVLRLTPTSGKAHDHSPRH